MEETNGNEGLEAKRDVAKGVFSVVIVGDKATGKS